MKFEVNDPSEYQNIYIIAAVHEVLKIDESRVQIRTYFEEMEETTSQFENSAPTATTTSSGRHNLSTYFVEVLILPDPDDPTETTPLQLGNQLQSYRVQLKDMLQPFDATYALYGTEVIGTSPTFASLPRKVSVVND